MSSPLQRNFSNVAKRFFEKLHRNCFGIIFRTAEICRFALQFCINAAFELLQRSFEQLQCNLSFWKAHIAEYLSVFQLVDCNTVHKGVER